MCHTTQLSLLPHKCAIIHNYKLLELAALLIDNKASDTSLTSIIHVLSVRNELHTGICIRNLADARQTYVNINIKCLSF